MRTMIAGFALATVALMLGGCAGGNTLLPSTGANGVQPQNVLGGPGIAARHGGFQPGNVLGGPGIAARRGGIHPGEVLGGPGINR